MIRATYLILTLVLLGGCATVSTGPTLSESHPAHPDATPAPPPRPSQTLYIEERGRPDEGRADGQAEPMDHGEHGNMDHGSHPAGAEADAGKGLYVCPMHPEVTSNDPDARCPKCGMALERKERSHDQ